jgi:hypothetical protein
MSTRNPPPPDPEKPPPQLHGTDRPARTPWRLLAAAVGFVLLCAVIVFAAVGLA